MLNYRSTYCTTKNKTSTNQRNKKKGAHNPINKKPSLTIYYFQLPLSNKVYYFLENNTSSSIFFFCKQLNTSNGSLSLKRNSQFLKVNLC